MYRMSSLTLPTPGRSKSTGSTMYFWATLGPLNGSLRIKMTSDELMEAEYWKVL